MRRPPRRGDGDSVWDEPALGAPLPSTRDEERVLHGIADEPILASRAPTGSPSLSFENWYRERQAATTWTRSWGVTFALMATGGVFAVLGAFMKASGGPPVLVYGMIVPIVEELMKVSPALILMERFPYLFRSWVQPWLVTLAAALSFATIENLLYLNVYIPEPSENLRAWRWSVCTAMHVGASALAGVGLHRLYVQTSREHSRVNLDRIFPFLIAAAALHGAYNLTMLFLDASGSRFLE
jgi:RsiW-degrading membrane proteinase PrsW (M82 family)